MLSSDINQAPPPDSYRTMASIALLSQPPRQLRLQFGVTGAAGRRRAAAPAATSWFLTRRLTVRMRAR